MTDKIIIIPSARLVPIELQAEFGPIPSAMIPVDGRPALHHLLAGYPITVETLIAIHEAGEEVSFYIDHHLDERAMKMVDVGSTGSLGETILRSLESLTELPQQLIVNFADTILSDSSTEGDCIHYALLDDVYRWTTFCSTEEGRITAINEKDTDKSLTADKSMAFIGVFGFANTAFFTQCLAECVGTAGEVDPFYRAIQQYGSIHPYTFRENQDWLDFGHLDTYYESRKQISSGCREFNEISVDVLRGRLTKTSRNTAKFCCEIEWYLNLPPQLQHIAPRVFSHQLDSSKPSIEMEFYGYPLLNDLYLYGYLDVGAWIRIFKSVEQTFADMAAVPLTDTDQAACDDACKEMYETKTLQRMNTYMHSREFEWSHREDLQINGSKSIPLPEIARLLHYTLARAGIYGKSDFSVIHGDPCFSNILYDRRNGIVRLIDPRGSFGSDGIYGDSRYDWCKVSHSIKGDYDFLVNGLFDLQMNDGDVALHPYLSARHLEIKDLYSTRMLRLHGPTECLRIRLLESLLFLSMIPLHQDRPRSQQAFLARGIELFSFVHQKLEEANE